MKSYIASGTACLGSVVLGAALGYPSPAIPNLNGNRNPFHVDVITQSWISSILTIGALVSSIFGGPMVDKFGRKLTMMLTAVPSVLGWAMIASSPNAITMEVGRFLTGIGIGFFDVGAPTYIAEIVPADVRGILGSCHELSVNFGIVLVYLLGYFLPWDWLAIVSCAILAVMVVLLAFMPETPRWLLMKQRREEAVEALTWLRGEGNINAELQEMEDSLRDGNQKVKLGDFRQRALYKPTLIITGLMFFHAFTGIDAVLAYTVDIFQASDVLLDPYLQTVIIGIVGFAGNLMSTLIIDRTGRRLLLIVSGIIITLSMACLSTYFLLVHMDPIFAQTYLSWLPITSLVVYHFSFTLAYGPIPFVMMSELVPNRARGLASGFVIAVLYACSFVVTKFFVDVNLATYDCGSYFIYTGSTAISVVFVYFCVPETKGKTLEQIEKYFQ